MIFSKSPNWAIRGIDKDIYKFFILRWQEILDENTFDAWQVRFSDICCILNELHNAAEVAELVHISHPNLKLLIDEALQIVKRDKLIAESYPFLSNYLRKLNELYDSRVRDKKDKDIDDFIRLVTVTQGNLNSYGETLIKTISDILVTQPEKYKIDLYNLIMSLGVHLKSKGYSMPFLRESINILTDSKAGDFQNRFLKMVKLYEGNENEYSCRFFVTVPEGIPIEAIDQIQFTYDRPNGDDTTEEENEFYNQDSQALIAIIKIRALDIYSARDNSEKLIESFFAKCFLYKPTKKAHIKHPLVLVTLSDGSKNCIGPDTSWQGYIRDFRKSDSQIVELSNIQKRLPLRDSSQLSASLQYHKLALSAKTEDARLVNLWIALESLVQTEGISAIERICTYIPASNSSGYIYRMMKALAISINSIWRHSETGELCKLLKYSKYQLHPEDMLRILLDDTDGPLITSFYDLIKDNPLLTFRIHHMRTDFFQNATKLANILKGNKKNIDWQLRRIYRVRNNVMHQGICLPGTRQLIQHLHSYYIFAIHNLIYDLKNNPNWTI
ncbi:MAG: hypothetical protein ABFD81_13875, partial [Syntrophaceae bacterium]